MNLSPIWVLATGYTTLAAEWEGWEIEGGPSGRRFVGHIQRPTSITPGGIPRCIPASRIATIRSPPTVSRRVICARTFWKYAIRWKYPAENPFEGVRAGQSPWPKLWHNLRASRESELMREYDLATVCRWIGNSPTIVRHYATSVDLNADFRKAAGLDAGQDSTRKQAAQNPTRAMSELMGTASHETQKPWICEGMRYGAINIWAIQDSNL